MSEVRVSEVAAFFRYLIPGIFLELFIFLAFPREFLRYLINAVDGTVIAVLVTGVFILFGWVSYHLIYPIWRALLVILHLYPKLRFVNELKKLMVKEDDLKPNVVWSFFLWNHCRDSVRERVKLLANYGHSLYMVSFAFFAFPLIYITSKLFIDSETLLLYLFATLLSSICPNIIPYFETLFMAFSLFVGIMVLYFGYERIRYAENIQWLIFNSRREEIMEILRKMNQIKKPAKTATTR